MVNKLKLVAIFEAVIIITLLLFLINSYKNKTDTNPTINKNGLLSPRVYSGLLQPKSLLIENFNPLKKVIEEKIIKSNPNISVYIVNLRDGASIGINERSGFPAASLNKIPVAILILKRVERGELSLDTMIEIKDSDRTSPGDLYKTKEKQLPLKVLLEKMIGDSDSTAFKTLRRNLDPKDMNFLENYIDYYSDDIASNGPTRLGIEGEGLINTKSIYNIFSSLYLSTLLTPKNSEYVLSLMTNTVFDIKKLANLPEDVTVAQKFGVVEFNGEKYFHDCGIIYINQSRIFYCIMTKNLDEDQTANTIGSIVYLTYEYVIKTRQNLDFIGNKTP